MVKVCRIIPAKDNKIEIIAQTLKRINSLFLRFQT
jgi:hypothetical protein